MPKNKSIRFVVSNKGIPRCLLSINEQANSELIIDLRGRRWMDNGYGGDPFGIRPDSIEDEIIKYRYTIHNSHDSPRKINTIKLHFSAENNPPVEEVIYTTAIKQDQKFAPIYSKLCTAINVSYYDLKQNAGAVYNLGNIDRFTILFPAFIGPSNLQFNPYCKGRSVEYLQVKFQSFSFVVVYSFLNLTPLGHTRWLHHASPQNTSMPGITSKQCVEHHCRVRENMRREYIDILLRELKPDTDITNYLQNSAFFREPREDTEEYNAWIQSVQKLFI